MSTVPLHLDGATMTAIIHDRVQAWIKRYPDWKANVFPDEVYPGTRPVSAQQEGLKMMMLTSPQDYTLLLNPEYFDLYMKGLMPQTPVSPYWANLMASKDMFQSHQDTFLDFMRKRAEYRQAQQILGPEQRRYVSGAGQ